MRPPQLAEQRQVVGSNPFYHPLFERAFATNDARDFFFQSVMFDRLKSALRDVVVDYYRSIAADTGKHEAIFFVEKLMDIGAHRKVVLSMFPEAKEILLVRDLRDVLCSRKNFTQQLPEDPVAPMRQSARHLIRTARNGGTSTIVVRYEDLVLREQQTLERLFESVGLNYVPLANLDEESRLFSKHATSKSPAASIGRWKKDLTEAEKEQANELFKEFLETFEYA